MEITKRNYYEMEPIILKDIEQSEFISFDLEFSGLCEFKNKLLDTPEERFKKTRFVAEDYRIIQIGLVPFIPIKEEANPEKNSINKKFIIKPYCIYVFPSEKQSNGRLDFDSKAIIFNKNNGIDFNKWICDGVPYLNSEYLNKLTERLLPGDINKYNPKDKNSFKYVSLFKEIDKNRYETFIQKFNDFYYKSEEKVFKYEKLMHHLVIYFLNKCEQKVLSTIFIEYKDEIVGDNIKSFMYFYKLNSFEEKKQKIMEEDNKKITIIKKEKGVKNLIDYITSIKKPIVGHNCMLDLLYIYSHFIDEIPREYKTFKLSITNKFSGGIYDTKFLFSDSNFDFDFGDKIEKENENKNKNIKNYQNKKVNKKNFHLEDLFKYLYEKNKNNPEEKKVYIEIEKNEKFKKYFNFESPECINSYHNADYDALVTGCSFAYLKEMLGEEYIKEHNYKINFIFGLYSCIDLNNEQIDEKYLNNCNDAVLLYFDKNPLDYETMRKMDCLINGKLVESTLEGKEKYNFIVCFIKSENKNEFLKECSNFKDYFSVSTVHEFKQIIENKNKIKLKSNSKK